MSRSKLAAFLRTLRDNGFAVGLAEGQDAAELMASGYARKPGLLRSAFKHLFSARKSDWEKFDGLFDAFWLGKRLRSRSLTMGSAKAANNPSLKSLQDTGSTQSGNQSPTDQVPSADDAPQGRGGEGRMEGASVPTISPKSISATSPSPGSWSRRIRPPRALRRRCVPA